MVFYNPNTDVDRDYNYDAWNYFGITSSATVSNLPPRASSPHEISTAESDENVPMARIETLPPLSPMPPSLFNTPFSPVEGSSRMAQTIDSSAAAISSAQTIDSSVLIIESSAQTIESSVQVIDSSAQDIDSSAQVIETSAPSSLNYTPNYNYSSCDNYYTASQLNLSPPNLNDDHNDTSSLVASTLCM